jgi:MtaA/CmuA family methyltransferase
MNGLQRYLATLRGGALDHLARTPILMQFAAEYVGSDYGRFAADHRVLVDANRRCADDFGIDQLSCISDPYRETHGFGGEVTFVPDGPPRCTAPLAETRGLEVLARPDPHRSERMLDRVRAAEAYRREDHGTRSLLGWVEGPAAEAADLRGVMPFMLDLMDDPEYAAELMDRCVEVAIDFARAQVEAGVDTVGIGDAIASQIDPGTYEALIQPREKRLVEAIQGMGAFVKLHICGNVTHLLPGIADLGVDVLDIDHMVDLAVARAAVGDRVVLTGNLDPVSVVRFGTPAGIRAAVSEAYARAGDPYMVNAGCEIPAGTPPENLRALCEPVRPDATVG